MLSDPVFWFGLSNLALIVAQFCCLRSIIYMDHRLKELER